MALWLRKGGGFFYVEAIVPKQSYTKCHSFAQRDTPELERHGSEPVRISTLDEKQCCKFMPLTFPPKPSMRTKGRKFRHSAPPNTSSDPDGDTAEWITKVVNDPLVEIDPVTMAQHLLAARKTQTGPGRYLSSLVATCRQPFTYFSPPPQGFGRVVVAVGAIVLLASLASGMHLFRARRQLEKVVSYDSSSDEENKLDLLSLVEAQREEQEEREEDETISKQKVADEEETSLHNVSPEVVYAVVAIVLSDEFQQAFAQQHEVKNVPKHLEPPVPGFLLQRPPSGKLANQEDVGVQSSNLAHRDDVGGPNVNLIKREDVGVQSLNLANREDVEGPGVNLTRREDVGVQSLNLANREGVEGPSVNLIKREEAEVQIVEQSSSPAKAELIPLETEKQAPEVKTDDLTAPFMSSSLDGETETSKDGNKQTEFLRELELLCLATFVLVFSGVPGTDQDVLAGDGLTDSGREDELRKVVQAAVPAVAVGAGAMSMITGVDGAFEVVGLAATASFIYYDLLFADSRKDLCEEFQRITDHKKLTEFLKSKKIVQPDI